MGRRLSDPSRFLESWVPIQHSLAEHGRVALASKTQLLELDSLPPSSAFDLYPPWLRELHSQSPALGKSWIQLQRLSDQWGSDPTNASLGDEQQDRADLLRVAIGWAAFSTWDFKLAVELCLPIRSTSSTCDVGTRDSTVRRTRRENVAGFLASLLVGRVAIALGLHAEAIVALANASATARRLELQDGLAMVAGARGEALLRLDLGNGHREGDGAPELQRQMYRGAAIEFNEAIRMIALGSRHRGRSLCYLAHAWSRLDRHSQDGAITLYRIAGRIRSDNGSQFAAAGLAVLGANLGIGALIDEAAELMNSRSTQDTTSKGHLWVAAARLRHSPSVLHARTVLNLVGGRRTDRIVERGWARLGASIVLRNNESEGSRVPMLGGTRDGDRLSDEWPDAVKALQAYVGCFRTREVSAADTAEMTVLSDYMSQAFDEGAAYSLRNHISNRSVTRIQDLARIGEGSASPHSELTLEDWWKMRRIFMP